MAGELPGKELKGMVAFQTTDGFRERQPCTPRLL